MIFADFTILSRCSSDKPTSSNQPHQERVGFTTQSKLSLNTIGPIKIGMTVGEASESIGRELTNNGDVNNDCYYVSPKAGPSGVKFMVIEGKIARIDIIDNQISTVSGARIGNTEAEILSLYPGQIEVVGHQYDENGHYLIFLPRDQKYSSYRLVFETDGKHVTTFRAGKLPEVQYVEGCS